MISTSSSVLEEQLLRLLGQYVSRINAQSLLSRSLPAGVRQGRVDEHVLPTIIARLQVNAALFVASEKREEFRNRLQQLQSSVQNDAQRAPAPETIAIEAEGDIVVARTRARIMCEGLGAGRVSAHKVATVVSELARNIVSYTPGGHVELSAELSPPAVSIRATDRGSGIPGLASIMSGKYRSKTGLGLGLLGSKRLADQFQVDSGMSGTTILARMRV